MHATRDTRDVIINRGVGGRVMRGVRLLLRYKHSADGMRGRAEWQRGLIEAAPAIMHGLTSVGAGRGRHGADWTSPLACRVM